MAGIFISILVDFVVNLFQDETQGYFFHVLNIKNNFTCIYVFLLHLYLHFKNGKYSFHNIS